FPGRCSSSRPGWGTTSSAPAGGREEPPAAPAESHNQQTRPETGELNSPFLPAFVGTPPNPSFALAGSLHATTLPNPSPHPPATQPRGTRRSARNNLALPAGIRPGLEERLPLVPKGGPA